MEDGKELYVVSVEHRERHDPSRKLLREGIVR